MLSAYFAGSKHSSNRPPSGVYDYTIGFLLNVFSSFQDWLELIYARMLKWIVRHSLRVFLASLIISIGYNLKLQSSSNYLFIHPYLQLIFS